MIGSPEAMMRLGAGGCKPGQEEDLMQTERWVKR
jgi:hypothetical protein